MRRGFDPIKFINVRCVPRVASIEALKPLGVKYVNETQWRWRLLNYNEVRNLILLTLKFVCV